MTVERVMEYFELGGEVGVDSRLGERKLKSGRDGSPRREGKRPG